MHVHVKKQLKLEECGCHNVYMYMYFVCILIMHVHVLLYVCRIVMKNKNSRSAVIQQAILLLLPRIAALNSELFALK